MKYLPSKFSNLWGRVFAGYAAFVFIFLILSQSILHKEFTGKSLIAFVMIAFVSALIACLGGFLGAKVYFVICALSAIAGTAYMMYIVGFNVSPGWGDLTSIIGYFFYIAMGIAIGIIAEVVLLLMKVKRK
jgi:hypothetical protein